jgi:hypothetical protein
VAAASTGCLPYKTVFRIPLDDVVDEALDGEREGKRNRCPIERSIATKKEERRSGKIRE